MKFSMFRNETEHKSITALSGGSKKGMVLLLRWVLIITCSCLILFQYHSALNRNAGHVLVLALIASNIFLSIAPERWFKCKYFDNALVTFDIILITASIWLSGGAKSELYLLYFLVIMIAAVGETLRAIIWSALLVSLVYTAALTSASGVSFLADTEVLIRIPFFFMVALFFGYFAQLVRIERSSKIKAQNELGVATRLREISNQLARTLDRQIILDTLVASVKDFCGVNYTAVVSRGSQTVLAEAGSCELAAPGIIFQNISGELRLNDFSNSSLAAELNKPEKQINNSNLSSAGGRFFSAGCWFLPFGGERCSDLYLMLDRDVEEEKLDYAGVLLASAYMALNNAGQYQALLYEVEKRKETVRHLGSALKFKSELTANITHEIRTPIYSFIGFAELLLSGGYGQLSQEQRDVISRMLDKARGLLQLVNNILDHAKLGSGEYKINLTSGNLKHFVQDIADTCAPLVKDKPVNLHAGCEFESGLVITDWGILRQILLNLVSNAIKFTEQGRIDITARYEGTEGMLRFAVSDTGMGIAAEHIKDIFEPFRQLENSYVKKYAGTGLGLAITKKQVEMLGGSIEVLSKIECGSKFTVSLPMKSTLDKEEIVSSISFDGLPVLSEQRM